MIHPQDQPSLAISQKAGRSDTRSGNLVLEVFIGPHESSKHRKQQSLSLEQLLNPSNSKDIPLAQFPRTATRSNMFHSHLSSQTSSWARLWRVTGGVSYLLDICDIPHPQLTVRTPSDQTLLFWYQGHPPDLSRGTTWGTGLWLL